MCIIIKSHQLMREFLLSTSFYAFDAADVGPTLPPKLPGAPTTMAPICTKPLPGYIGICLPVADLAAKGFRTPTFGLVPNILLKLLSLLISSNL